MRGRCAIFMIRCRRTVRIVAKKALIAKLSGLDLQDTDPTHEVLDVVISYLETLLGPMVNCVRALRPEASLQDDVGRGAAAIVGRER